jgi:hypothetical protein
MAMYGAFCKPSAISQRGWLINFAALTPQASIARLEGWILGVC